jgi:flagellar biosynthetic protein FliQ
MNETYLLNLAQNAMLLAALLSAPILLATLLIGSLVSLLQAATQVNEFTLTFVPKIIAVIVILLFLGGWMLQQIMAFTTNLYNDLPTLILR